MERIFETEAIVLKKVDWKDNDLIFSLFTNSFGKINLLAVGAKKIKSKLAGQLSLPGFLKINFIKGKKNDKLIQVYCYNLLPIKDEKDFLFWQLMVELLEKTVPVGEINKDIFSLSEKFFIQIILEKRLEKKLLLLSVFIIKKLAILGYDIEEREKDISLGGLVGEKDLRSFVGQVKSLSSGGSVSLGSTKIVQLIRLLRKFLEYHVDKEFKGLRFITENKDFWV